MTATAFNDRSILFLASRESAVRTDTASLRSLNARRITYAPTAYAAMLLLQGEGKKFDHILCDAGPGKTEVMALLRSLAHDAALAGIPLLALSSDADLTRRLEEIGVLTLQRPYTTDQLEKCLEASFRHPPLNIDAIPVLPPPKVEKKISPIITTSEWFAKGMEYLQAGSHTKAERAFREVLRRKSDHKEACIALARVRRAKGDTTGMHRLLLRAAVLTRREGELERAAAITALLPAQWQEGSIFTHEAMACLEEGMYQEAAFAFMDLLDNSPESTLISTVARACQFTDDPEAALAGLCSAFERMGMKATARRIRFRLLRDAEAVPPQRVSWLDRFPRLKEMAGVASYTAWAWRHAS